MCDLPTPSGSGGMCECLSDKEGELATQGGVLRKRELDPSTSFLWDGDSMTNHPEGINTKSVSL